MSSLTSTETYSTAGSVSEGNGQVGCVKLPSFRALMEAINRSSGLPSPRDSPTIESTGEGPFLEQHRERASAFVNEKYLLDFLTWFFSTKEDLAGCLSEMANHLYNKQVDVAAGHPDVIYGNELSIPRGVFRKWASDIPDSMYVNLSDGLGALVQALNALKEIKETDAQEALRRSNGNGTALVPVWNPDAALYVLKAGDCFTRQKRPLNGGHVLETGYGYQPLEVLENGRLGFSPVYFGTNVSSLGEGSLSNGALSNSRNKDKSPETSDEAHKNAANALSALHRSSPIKRQKSATKEALSGKVGSLDEPSKARKVIKKRSRGGRPRKSAITCVHCLSRETPEWRKGPDGFRTLCNACGLFYSKLLKRYGHHDAAVVLNYRKEHAQELDRAIPTLLELRSYFQRP